MGLRLGPLACNECGSRNTDMVKLHQYKCFDCGHEWTDPTASLAASLQKAAANHAVIMSGKFPDPF